MKFKINQKVFYTSAKVPAVIKGFEKNKVFITYFPKGETKRTNKLVEPSKLKPYRKIKNNSNRYYYAVRKFHAAFKHPKSNKPTPMDANMAIKRMSWTLEEIVEFIHASSESKEQFSTLFEQLIVNGQKTYEKLLNTPLPESAEDRLLAQVDAVGDILYFNQGDFNILGVKPDRIFDAIQAANMRKLHEDGKPRFREGDGKIIKPEGWYGPEKDIQKEIERQANAVNKTKKS
jgi:predicted HAD superfamily Cof-like phosphohydrolase